MCCFGSVRNSLFLINFLNIQELRGEASLSRGLRDPCIYFVSFSIDDNYPLPSCEPYWKRDCYNSLSLFNMDRLCFVSLEF